MAWKILWTDAEGKRRIKKFKTTEEALAFGKPLKKQGLVPYLVSGTHAYPQSAYKKAGERPSSRHLWCPYCIRWRIFKVSALRFDGIRGPEELRCSICTISVADYHVRELNNLLGKADEKAIFKGIKTLRAEA